MVFYIFLSMGARAQVSFLPNFDVIKTKKAEMEFVAYILHVLSVARQFSIILKHFFGV